MDMGEPVCDVLQAALDAGSQLIMQGAVSEETLKIIGRQILPLDMYIGMVNEHFMKELRGSGTN
ncbi:MAG TPA: hypothetical protein PLZ42_02305 [Methanothrix sp.]|nr:hypothetical protein [Methanothrix sp.]